MHTEASFPLAAITKVYPDPTGTRLVCVDEKSDAYLHNPVSSSVHIHLHKIVHVYMYMYVYVHCTSGGLQCRVLHEDRALVTITVCMFCYNVYIHVIVYNENL